MPNNNAKEPTKEEQMYARRMLHDIFTRTDQLLTHKILPARALIDLADATSTFILMCLIAHVITHEQADFIAGQASSYISIQIEKYVDNGGLIYDIIEPSDSDQEED